MPSAPDTGTQNPGRYLDDKPDPPKPKAIPERESGGKIGGPASAKSDIKPSGENKAS